ncbi:MAG: NfeD family protein [Bacilli bacterium]
MVYMWLIIVIILGIFEMLTTNLVSIWFVISGIATMIVSLFCDNLYIQFGLFVILGVLLMPLSKKIYKKIKKDKVKTNIDRILGMKGIVTESITKDSIGEVKVDGKKWSAYSDTNISKGEIVRVLSINSTKIKVEKWEEK